LVTLYGNYPLGNRQRPSKGPFGYPLWKLIAKDLESYVWKESDRIATFAAAALNNKDGSTNADTVKYTDESDKELFSPDSLFCVVKLGSILGHSSGRKLGTGDPTDIFRGKEDPNESRGEDFIKGINNTEQLKNVKDSYWKTYNDKVQMGKTFYGSKEIAEKGKVNSTSNSTGSDSKESDSKDSDTNSAKTEAAVKLSSINNFNSSKVNDATSANSTNVSDVTNKSNSADSEIISDNINHNKTSLSGDKTVTKSSDKTVTKNGKKKSESDSNKTGDGEIYDHPYLKTIRMDAEHFDIFGNIIEPAANPLDSILNDYHNKTLNLLDKGLSNSNTHGTVDLSKGTLDVSKGTLDISKAQGLSSPKKDNKLKKSTIINESNVTEEKHVLAPTTNFDILQNSSNSTNGSQSYASTSNSSDSNSDTANEDSDSSKKEYGTKKFKITFAKHTKKVKNETDVSNVSANSSSNVSASTATNSSSNSSTDSSVTNDNTSTTEDLKKNTTEAESEIHNDTTNSSLAETHSSLINSASEDSSNKSSLLSCLSPSIGLCPPCSNGFTDTTNAFNHCGTNSSECIESKNCCFPLGKKDVAIELNTTVELNECVSQEEIRKAGYNGVIQLVQEEKTSSNSEKSNDISIANALKTKVKKVFQELFGSNIRMAVNDTHGKTEYHKFDSSKNLLDVQIGSITCEECTKTNSGSESENCKKKSQSSPSLVKRLLKMWTIFTLDPTSYSNSVLLQMNEALLQFNSRPLNLDSKMDVTSNGSNTVAKPNSNTDSNIVYLENVKGENSGTKSESNKKENTESDRNDKSDTNVNNLFFNKDTNSNTNSNTNTEASDDSESDTTSEGNSKNEEMNFDMPTEDNNESENTSATENSNPLLLAQESSIPIDELIVKTSLEAKNVETHSVEIPQSPETEVVPVMVGNLIGINTIGNMITANGNKISEDTTM